MSLTELTRQIQSGRITQNAVVVTFDDGYADNLVEAKPLLEKYGIPATFFIASGQVNQCGEFWWDELERLILLTERLPSRLELILDEVEVVFEFQDTALFSKGVRKNLADWHVMSPEEPTERHRLYRRLCQVIRPMTPQAREQAMRSLCQWAGDSGTGRPSHRPLTSVELKDLASTELLEIGAHTVSHHTLSSLDAKSQTFEIAQSKAQVEGILGQTVSNFSYPFGGRNDYTANTVELVKRSGFRSSCSNFPGWVRRGCDPFQLPRFVVRDWNGDEFLEQYRDWLSI